MKPCPQCTSLFCGEYACRFTALTHERASELRNENAYACAMVKRDQVQPAWLRALKTGARE